MKLSVKATLKQLSLTKKDFSIIAGITPEYMSKIGNEIDELPIYIKTIIQLLKLVDENKRLEYIQDRLK